MSTSDIVQIVMNVFLLVTSATLTWKSLTPPHISAPSERLAPPTVVGQYAAGLTLFIKSSHAVFCVVQTSIVLLQAYDIYYPSNFVGTPYSYKFLAGMGIGISGSLLRLTCYRVLGRFFTFEMAIRSEHTLITSGPYAYVRHPAYTGLVMTMGGAALVQVSAPSYLHRMLSSSYPQSTFAVFTFASNIYIGLFMMSVLALSLSATTRRLKAEEAALKKKFGNEWEQWAAKTRYKLVPLVY